MSRVHLVGTLVCSSSDEADTVRRLLPRHRELTLAEPGCPQFDVTPTDNPLEWSVEELFTDDASFERHQERASRSVWGRETATIERRYTVTRVS